MSKLSYIDKKVIREAVDFIALENEEVTNSMEEFSEKGSWGLWWDAKGLRNSSDKGDVLNKMERYNVLQQDILACFQAVERDDRKAYELTVALYKKIEELERDAAIHADGKSKALCKFAKEFLDNKWKLDHNVKRVECVVLTNELKRTKDFADTLNQSLEKTIESFNSLQEDYQTLHEDNQTLKEGNQTLHEDNQKLQEDYQTLHEDNQKLQEGNQTLHEDNQKLQEGNQTLHEDNQKLQEGNQTLHEDNQKLQEGNQTLHEDNQKLQKGNQKLHEDNQKLQKSVDDLHEENLKLNDSMRKVLHENQSLKDMISDAQERADQRLREVIEENRRNIQKLLIEMREMKIESK